MSGVKKQKVQFETSDGMEFDTEAEAEKHEELYQANQEYQAAYRKLGKVLAETQTTADGEKFEFGLFRDYQHIVVRYGSWPYLETIPYLGWHWNWDNTDDNFTISYEDPTGIGKWSSVAIQDLYANKRKAREMLVAAREKRLAELTEELNETRSKLA